METDIDRKKQIIINRIFSRTPFDYIPSVIAFLARALENEPQMEDMLISASSSYNKSHILSIDVEGLEHPSLITNFNEVKDGYFCDPRNKVLFHFDHLSRNVLSRTPWEVDKDWESWRKVVEDAFLSYAKKYFSNGCVGVYAAMENGATAITACIVERAIDEANCSSSCWRSVWTMFMRPDAAEIRIKGSVQVEGFYTESGHSFMAAEDTIDSAIPLLDQPSSASAVINVVKQFEEEFQKSVGNYFLQTSDLMKLFRRRLPIIKTNFNWNFVVKPLYPSELPVGQTLN